MRVLYRYIILTQQQFETDKKDLKGSTYTEDVPTDYNPRWAEDF
jgi:hypothetical protein